MASRIHFRWTGLQVFGSRFFDLVAFGGEFCIGVLFVMDRKFRESLDASP